MALVFVGGMLLIVVAASILAIDVGMVMTARSQAQNSADAGALAGAISLGYDDYADRSASGPAVRNALAGSLANLVMSQSVSVTTADVTFPLDDNGLPNWVRVQVHRTAARGNPVPTLIARYFGRATADITAVAMAEAAPANAATCLKPFSIPDKWIERQTPPWDPTDTFDMVDNKGSPLANPDVYVPTGNAGYTGYDPEVDRGTRLILKADNASKLAPSFYYPLALPGSTGGDDYRWNIENCNTSVMAFGNLMTAEPGNMVGPTYYGVATLIARDPTAYWDASAQRVVSPMAPSPRVGIVPIFDPVYYDTGKRNGRNADLRAVNFIGFFFEGFQGNNVMGRMVPVGGLLKGELGPAPAGAYPRAVRVVE